MCLIVMRIFQGVGAAMLMANSAAILTDAFPEDQRGMALGINQAAAFSGIVHRPGARAGSWPRSTGGWSSWCRCRSGCSPRSGATCKLRELGQRRPAHIDWPGNITFALGLVAGHGRHHLRDRALRRPRDGLDQPHGDRRAGRRRRCCWWPSASSRPGWRADVPPAAVPDPRLHQRRAGQLPGRHRAAAA